MFLLFIIIQLLKNQIQYCIISKLYHVCMYTSSASIIIIKFAYSFILSCLNENYQNNIIVCIFECHNQ